MKKANFSWNLNTKKFDQMKSAVADQLLSDPEILDIVKSLNMSQEEIDKYLGWLISLQEARQACRECQGINKCKSEFKGMVPVIERVEGKLNQKIKTCEKFYKDSNYIIKDFSGIYEEALLTNVVLRGTLPSLVGKLFSYTEDTKQKGLMILGGQGSGKTFVSAALTNELAKNGIKCAFVDVKKLVKEARQMLFNKEKFAYQDLFDSLCEVPVLVLDNLGDETKTEWSRDEFIGSILSQRNKSNLATFITTKYNEQKLLTLYSSVKTDSGYAANKLMVESFINIIKESCPVCHNLGQKKLENL